MKALKFTQRPLSKFSIDDPKEILEHASRKLAIIIDSSLNNWINILCNVAQGNLSTIKDPPAMHLFIHRNFRLVADSRKETGKGFFSSFVLSLSRLKCVA